MSRQWAQKNSQSNSSLLVQKSSSRQQPFTDLIQHAPAPKQTPSVQTKRRNVDWSRVTVEAQSRAGVQAKLSVGAPGDKYEQEADAMENKVMTMPAPESEQPIQRERAPEENKKEEVQAKPLAASLAPLVQRETAPRKTRNRKYKPNLWRVTSNGKLPQRKTRKRKCKPSLHQRVSPKQVAMQRAS